MADFLLVGSPSTRSSWGSFPLFFEDFTFEDVVFFVTLCSLLQLTLFGCLLIAEDTREYAPLGIGHGRLQTLHTLQQLEPPVHLLASAW